MTFEEVASKANEHFASEDTLYRCFNDSYNENSDSKQYGRHFC